MTDIPLLTPAADGPAGPTDPVAAAMAAYTPDCLPAELWRRVAPACIDLVGRAGAPNKERAVKDLQILAKVAAVLRERNRPVTLDEMLTDGALRDLDQAERRARLAGKTRLNHRAIVHRLQAAHRDLPWQPGRNKPQPAQPRHGAAVQLERLACQAGGEPGGDAEAFRAVLAAADVTRASTGAVAGVDGEVWRAASRFAGAHGVRLTRAMVRDSATLRVLAQTAPLAELVARYRLTRRDLDLVVPFAAALPDRPDDDAARALRGSS